MPCVVMRRIAMSNETKPLPTDSYTLLEWIRYGAAKSGLIPTEKYLEFVADAGVLVYKYTAIPTNLTQTSVVELLGYAQQLLEEGTKDTVSVPMILSAIEVIDRCKDVIEINRMLAVNKDWFMKISSMLGNEGCPNDNS